MCLCLCGCVCYVWMSPCMLAYFCLVVLFWPLKAVVKDPGAFIQNVAFIRKNRGGETTGRMSSARGGRMDALCRRAVILSARRSHTFHPELFCHVTRKRYSRRSRQSFVAPGQNAFPHLKQISNKHFLLTVSHYWVEFGKGTYKHCSLRLEHFPNQFQMGGSPDWCFLIFDEGF